MISDELGEGVRGRIVFSDHFWSVVGCEIAETLNDGGYFHQVGSFSWQRMKEVIESSSDLFGSYMKSVVISLDGMTVGKIDAWLEETLPCLMAGGVRLVLVTSNWALYGQINEKTRSQPTPICA